MNSSHQEDIETVAGPHSERKMAGAVDHDGNIADTPISRGLHRTAEQLEAKRQARNSNRTESTASTSAAPPSKRGLSGTPEELEVDRSATASNSALVPLRGLKKNRVLLRKEDQEAAQTRPSLQRGLRRTAEERAAKKAARSSKRRDRAPTRASQPDSPGIKRGLHKHRDRQRASSDTPLVPRETDLGYAEALVEGESGMYATPTPVREGLPDPEDSYQSISEDADESTLLSSHQEDDLLFDDEPMSSSAATAPSLTDDNSGLVEARPVSDDTGSIMEAQEVDRDILQQKEIKAKKEKECRRVGYVLIAVSLTVVAIAVALTVGRNPKETKDTRAPSISPSMLPSVAPSLAPTGPIDELVATFPNQTIKRLEDPTTSQSKAYDWLLKHPEISNMEDWKIKELFGLATFYFSFGGPHWPGGLDKDWLDYDKSACAWFSSDFGDLNNYLSLGNINYKETSRGRPPCDEEASHFISLYLSKILNLHESAVEIPPETAFLTSLKAIILDGNNINASFSELVPEELTPLADLTELDISKNEFIDGTIPQYFGQLSSLWRFEGYTNQLSGPLPSSFGLLSNLAILDLEQNELSGPIPTEFGVMSSLWSLRLDNNHLSGEIPSSLGLLTDLEILELENNNFTSLPSEIFLLTKLRTLYLDHELLHQMPSELALLTNLKDFALVGYECNTTGFPMNIFNQTAPLTKLELSGQSLTGTIPTLIGMLTDLYILDLAHNQLSGPIPSQLGFCTNLGFINLANNSLSGSLPTELGMIFDTNYFLLGIMIGGKATGLNISTNVLTGTIPTQIGRSTGTTQLDLQNNALSGRIPTELAELGALDILNLNNNALNGTLPHEVASLGARLFYVGDNSLTGTIPSSLGMSPNRLALDLRNNSFAGTIPGELVSITDLVYLHVGMNSVTGTIPEGLGLLTGGPSYFQYLRMYFQENGGLTGSLPPGFADRAAEGILNTLNISGTNLSGTLEEEYCSLQDESCVWTAEFSDPIPCSLSFDCSKDLCGCNCTCL